MRLTPNGRGAVATLRLRGSPGLLDAGEPPLFRTACGLPVAKLPVDRIAFGWFGETAPEEVLVCRLSPEELELHCHGGDAAANRIECDLVRRGAQRVDWGSDLAATQPLFERECLQAVVQALTPRTAKLAYGQYAGRLRKEIENSLDRLPDAPAALEVLQPLLDRRSIGLKLCEPWRVAVVGRPNVGKSRLINALLGYERSIVFDSPGTTRDVVTGETAFDGWPVRLADTAGVRDTACGLEAEAIARGADWRAQADLVLLVLDRSTELTPTDAELLARFPGALVVANKCDLAGVWPTERGMYEISAATGSGLPALQQEIVRRLIPLPVAATDALLVSQRQVELLGRAAAELNAGGVESARKALRELLGET